MEYWIGVDIGTTNTKAVAFNDSGEVKSQHNQGYEMIHPEPDFSEMDAEIIWEAVQNCLQKVIKELDGPVRAITFCAAMHSLMAVDSDGMPMTNLVIWADNRATEEADSLVQSEVGKQIYEACGTPLHPMIPLCKLMWWQKHNPELIHSAFKFVGIKEYIWYKLTKEWVIDYSLASATAMFDIHELVWNELALQTAGINADKLSKPVSTYYSVAEIQHGALDLFESSLDKVKGTQWVIGASDGCLANLGTGAVTPGRVAITIGTSGAVRVSAKKPILDAKKRTFCYLLDEETYIIGGGTNSGGVVFQWLRDAFFPGQSEDELTEKASEIPVGAQDLVFLPYLLGERAPIWNVHAKGSFYGLTLQHTSAHFIRAVLEGICLHTYSIVRILEERDDVHEIYASGGFAKSERWVQMLADVCGKTVCLPESVEAGAWGAALMGMKAAGIIQDYQEKLKGLKVDRSFKPNPGNAAQYQQIFDRFMKLYEATKSL